MSRTAWIWIVVIIILLIVGIAVWGGNNANDININDTDTTRTGGTDGSVSGQIVGKNAVNVDDQPVSRTVNVSMVELEAKGFAVVHERTPNGRPGAVLGASALLPAGRSNNVAVPLSASLVDGRTYIVMLHLDNGDGTPSEATDPAARDADSNEVMMEFTADADATVNGSVNL